MHSFLLVMAPKRGEAQSGGGTTGSDAAAGVGGSGFTDVARERVYFRPSPDKPRFVEAGGVITRGTTVCMLEVMKSYSRINYDAESLPERARVVSFLIADGADVEIGTPILELEPV